MSQDKPLPFQYQFAAGAIAGVSEILLMYPLDVVKTRVSVLAMSGVGEAELIPRTIASYSKEKGQVQTATMECSIAFAK